MKRITVPEEGIETLFGSYDENLKHLEARFNVRIKTQGHDLLVEGDSPDHAPFSSFSFGVPRVK